jgi:polyisoprenoid-binding protein YceI
MNTRFLDVSALAVMLALSSMTFAKAQVASASPDAVKAGTYKVEPYHTQIGFSISHFGFTNFSGFFSGASGSLTLDPANVGASKLDVSVPVQSVLTTVPVLTTELKNAQWFDVAKYPVATFVSTEVTKTGADTATIEGNLTLHGVTQPVTLQAHLIGSGVNPLDNAFTAGFEAIGEIKRSAFGIKQYLPLLGDNVTLTIAGAFELAK